MAKRFIYFHTTVLVLILQRSSMGDCVSILCTDLQMCTYLTPTPQKMYIQALLEEITFLDM